MKYNLIKLFAIISLIAAIGVSSPVQSTEKKTAIKVKTGTICPTSVPKSSAKKTADIAKKPIVKKAIPRLLDLGANKCIPCKMMAPILDEIAKEYKGNLKVEFIDVWKDSDAGQKYKISSIPTQIFYDANGKEFTRHVGFFSKEDILKTFEKQGIKLKKSAKK